MKLKKSHINISLLIFILSFTVIGSTNQSFTPQIILETPKTSDGEIIIVTPENKTYTEPDSGYYPATYGFESDEIGTNIDFIELEESTGSCTLKLIPSFNNHEKVLDLYDTSWEYSAGGKNIFNEGQDYGTVEFWWALSDVTRSSYVWLEDSSANDILVVRYSGSSFGRFDNGGWQVISGAPTPSNNQWYHIRIDWELTAGGYMGLSQNNFSLYIDGIQYGPYTVANTNTPDRLYLQTGVGASGGFHFYMDAIGYSWDPNYNIGDNLNEGLLLSYDNTTTLDWKGLSLDGQSNQTILGNTTIPMPADGGHNIQVFGNDTMGTMYESNLRYFTVDTSPYLNIVTPENKTYTELMNGYYPGTFGFENDRDGNIPEDWVDLSTNPVCIIEVESNLDGHNNVLKLEDPSTTYSCGTENIFQNQTEGTVELWFQKTVERTSCYIVLEQEATQAVVMAIDSNNNGLFGLNVGGVFEYVSAGYSDYEWFHIRIDFDCGTGKTDIYINNILQFENKDFFNAAPNVSQLRFSGNSNLEGTYYIDAVSYSWDPHYIIGDNYNEGLLLSYDSNIAHNWTGFSLDGGANKTILGNTTIQMPSDGQHQIQVFGNDSLGNIYESEVRYFDVDVNPVDISIISPTNNELFQSSAPSFEIYIDDPDLNSTWYSLDGGITNIPFTGFTGFFDQTEWNKVINGTVVIAFYANDSVNHISYESVTARKDILGPIITVNSPQDDDVIGINAPNYDLSIEEFHLDSMWYSLDYGVTVFPIFSLTGTLDQAEWDSKGGGTVPIRFYANDSLGHESFTDVLVAKDLIFPIITINSPDTGEVFGTTSPTYDISISESNLDSYWYTIDGGAINITISSLTGTISQAEWNKQGNGTITIERH